MAKGGRHAALAPNRKGTRMPRTNGRTPRQALEMFRAEGKHEEAALLERLLDGPRQPTRSQRRQALFSEDVVDFLEAQDRRRDAARRLPSICPFSNHPHTLGCHDPLAQVS